MLAPGVGPWVEVGQGESWQVQPQAPRGSRAAGGSGGVRRRSGSVLERGIGRMRLPRVRGSRACWLRLCPLSGVPVSGLPCCHCQGPAEVPETKTGWLGRDGPGRGAGLSMADPRTAGLAAQEWTPMAAEPRRVGLAGRVEAGTRPRLVQKPGVPNNSSSDNDVGSLPSSAGLWGLPFSRLTEQAAVQRRGDS